MKKDLEKYIGKLGTTVVDSSINPIPAEVLENQDTLGGGVNLTPPCKSHV